MNCSHFKSNTCRSCQWLAKPYIQQLADKQHHLQQLLQEVAVGCYLDPVASEPAEFRNKAKMAVGGTIERPSLGISRPGFKSIDLCDCPLYLPALRQAFPVMKRLISRIELTPYNVNNQCGELKFILLTQNECGQLMLRLVLRSRHKLDALRISLPWLMAQLPNLEVVSVNIQPIHMAILEGDEEIILTSQTMLRQTINGIPLYLKSGSFFQTNSQIAEKLYAAARDWLSVLPVNRLWDLFCGVGGFGLHCKTNNNWLTGIEINQQAIECAKRTIREMALTHINFQALDSTAFASTQFAVPDVVIVNPPRRGIGKPLCHYLHDMAPTYILYSSCNSLSMIEDIRALSFYHIEKIQLFDMFPHTAHYEVLTLLKRY